MRSVSLLLVVMSPLFLTGCPCPTELRMGILLTDHANDAARKQSLGNSKVAYICPGESVTIAWNTKDASSLSFSPSIGSNALPMGFTAKTFQSDTTVTGTASGTNSGGGACSVEDSVRVFVVDPGDTIDFVLGFSNNHWDISPSPTFFSSSIKVSRVSLGQGTYPAPSSQWQVRHFSPSGDQTVFDLGNGTLSADGKGVSLLGTWEVASTDVYSYPPDNNGNPTRSGKPIGMLDLILEVTCK